MKRNSGFKEKSAHTLFCVCAVFSVFAVIAIICYLVIAGIPALREIGLGNFLFGTNWSPSADAAASAKFGIATMLVSSLAVTLCALALGGTMGLFTAIFLAFFCPKKLKGLFTQMIQLLAGIPSIVYGLFGLTILVPMFAKVSPTNIGQGLMATGLILSIMILPTVASIAKDNLEAVPYSYYEGAVALGATKAQAVFRILLPAARSGVVSALILGVGRAIGETMAVVMVCGNAVQFPTGFFISIATLTTNIVTGMPYADAFTRSALIATGLVLLVFILIINISLYLLKRKRKDRGGARKLKPRAEEMPVYRYRPAGCGAAKWVSIGFAALTAISLSALVVFILVRGMPNITGDLLFGESTLMHRTLAPAFVSTGILILVSLAIALPLGIGAAVYLVEYAKKGSKIVVLIRLFTDTLAGVPSIVFGLFGMVFFRLTLGMEMSLFIGGVTLSLMILPTVVRSVEESLLSVPDELREGSFALGAGKVRTIFRIVLPQALRGILTAVILSVGRIVGESAVLLYTAGTSPLMPDGIFSQGASFAVSMYMFANEGLYVDQAYGTAAVLLLVVVLLNLLVGLCGRKKKI